MDNRFHSYFARFIKFAQELALKNDLRSVEVVYKGGHILLVLNCGSSCAPCTGLVAPLQTMCLPQDIAINTWKFAGMRQIEHDCTVMRKMNTVIKPWLLAGRLAPPLDTLYKLRIANALPTFEKSGPYRLYLKSTKIWSCLVCQRIPNAFHRDSPCCGKSKCVQVLWQFVHGAYCCWVSKQLFCGDISALICCALADQMNDPVYRQHFFCQMYTAAMDAYVARLQHEHLSRNSELKKYSNKPVWLTSRDATFVTAVSLIITLCVLYLWYYASSTPASQRTYLVTALQTIASCFLAQFVCEYTGINNMIAESSIRYSKGTTLEKYANGRNNIVYQTALQMLHADPEQTFWHRLDALCAANDDPYGFQEALDANAGYHGLTSQDTKKMAFTDNPNDIRKWLSDS